MQIKTGVALKILVPGAAGERELSIQNEILHSVRDPSRLILYTELFYLNSRQGNHLVLVFPIRGPSLGNRLRQVSMTTRMSAAWQLLQALEDLHSNEFVHRGG
jgi:serine/threonine protein kinase